MDPNYRRIWQIWADFGRSNPFIQLALKERSPGNLWRIRSGIQCTIGLCKALIRTRVSKWVGMVPTFQLQSEDEEKD